MELTKTQVEIRQKNFPSPIIDKEGVMIKSHYPGAVAGGTLRQNMYGWLTGLQPEEEKQYGELLGKDLSKRSVYWEDLIIKFISPQNEHVRMNLSDPEDYIKYKACIASGIIAPSREALNEDLYLNTSYYFHNVQVEQNKDKIVTKERNKLIGKLSNFDENRAWLLYVNFALGLPENAAVSTDRFYTQLDRAIRDIKTEKDVKEVRKVFEKDNLVLQSEFVVHKAIDNRLLVWDSVQGVYVFDGKNWGSKRDDVVKKISNPQYLEDLAKLSEIVLKDYDI